MTGDEIVQIVERVRFDGGGLLFDHGVAGGVGQRGDAKGRCVSKFYAACKPARQAPLALRTQIMSEAVPPQCIAPLYFTFAIRGVPHLRFRKPCCPSARPNKEHHYAELPCRLPIHQRQDGVLKLTIPRREEAQPRRIEVTTG